MMMRKNDLGPQTLIEAVRYFSDLDACEEYMAQIKWPDGKIICPECGGNRIGRIKSRRLYQCRVKDCRKQFSSKVGSIFEDSPIGLDRWFVAVWCIANAKNGISSCELARAIGVTQKSAWHMLHRIRLAMKTDAYRQLAGEVESDESMIGGKAKNMHKKKWRKLKASSATSKAVVHGLLERGGNVIANVVGNQKKRTLQNRGRRFVEPGADLYTDSLLSYEGLANAYIH